MKKKTGKTQGKAWRSAAKDLTAKKGAKVKGGAKFNEFTVSKLVDKSSPTF